MNAVQRPFPSADEYSAPFFAHLGQGRLTVQYCGACGERQLGQGLCITCGSEQLDWRAASGAGIIHTFVIMHVGYHPAFADQIPYNAAVVELEEGPRLFTNILNVPHSQLRIGLLVHVEIVEIDSGLFMPCFKAVDLAPWDFGRSPPIRTDTPCTL